MTSLDVIGHELTHGVTEDEAHLIYFFQPGALNESVSDVFGSLVKQRVLNQTAAQADWLIGAGLYTANVNGVALRSIADRRRSMRIEFHTAGGIAHFPGLSRPSVIESDGLAEEDARDLQRLVEATRFFQRPTVLGTPRRGAADYRQYTITVEEGGRQHIIRLTDPVEGPSLQQLLRFLQTKARVLRRGAAGA
jgi:hypothetical protein